MKLSIQIRTKCPFDVRDNLDNFFFKLKEIKFLSINNECSWRLRRRIKKCSEQKADKKRGQKPGLHHLKKKIPQISFYLAG